MDNILQTIFWVAFSLTILFILYKAFQRVPEANVKLVERLGRYSRTLKPGINFIIPFIDSIVDPIKLPTIKTQETLMLKKLKDEI